MLFQKLSTLKLADDQALEQVHAALTVIDTFFANVPVLAPNVKKGVTPMGEKSGEFCRQTLVALSRNPGVVPPNLDISGALSDLKTRDLLGPFLLKLEQVYKRLVDADFALGADIMAASLYGYRQLKSMGRAAGLETLQREVGTRFAKRTRVKQKPLAA